MNIYENCPKYENDRFLIRKFAKEDCDDLLKVYSDKNALPFFNSDNCNGDNFYYSTKERMMEALNFWDYSYQNGWFVRFSIIDKTVSEAIGTIELCLQASEDRGILRVDVRSDYEKQDLLFNIISLITPKAFDMLGCSAIISKAPIYAVERIKAVKQFGFVKFEQYVIGGQDKYPYNGYWIANKVL